MYCVPVYKPQPLWIDALHFFFVALPVAGLVLTAVHIAFWIIDFVRWVNRVTNVVRSSLSGRMMAATDIVGNVGCNNPTPGSTQ